VLFTVFADSSFPIGEERLDVHSPRQWFCRRRTHKFWKVTNDCEGGSTYLQHGTDALCEYH